jgi:hypothetical protein
VTEEGYADKARYVSTREELLLRIVAEARLHASCRSWEDLWRSSRFRVQSIET